MSVAPSKPWWVCKALRNFLTNLHDCKRFYLSLNDQSDRQCESTEHHKLNVTSVQVIEVLVNVLFDLTKFSIPKTQLGIELTLIATGKINSLKAEC